VCLRDVSLEPGEVVGYWIIRKPGGPVVMRSTYESTTHSFAKKLMRISLRLSGGAHTISRAFFFPCNPKFGPLRCKVYPKSTPIEHESTPSERETTPSDHAPTSSIQDVLRIYRCVQSTTCKATCTCIMHTGARPIKGARMMRNVDVICLTVTTDDDSVKLPKSVTNFLFSG
jgi:hypothetical protein